MTSCFTSSSRSLSFEDDTQDIFGVGADAQERRLQGMTKERSSRRDLAKNAWKSFRKSFRKSSGEMQNDLSFSNLKQIPSDCRKNNSAPPQDDIEDELYKSYRLSNSEDTDDLSPDMQYSAEDFEADMVQIFQELSESKRLDEAATAALLLSRSSSGD